MRMAKFAVDNDFGKRRRKSVHGRDGRRLVT
jgi:hypothetical protein